MDQISKLIEYFKEFPGIGPRQARRLVYFLLTRNSSYLEEISKLILSIKKNIRLCESCFRFYTPTGTADYQDGNTIICSTCSDERRNASQLMIVTRDVDYEVVEKSSFYNGYYFILGGTIPILDKEPEKKIRLYELINRIKKSEKDKIKEIILSLNANTEGEYTAEFIRDYLKEKFTDINGNNSFSITVLGRGLSTGTELEYSDSDTIKNALKNRKKI